MKYSALALLLASNLAFASDLSPEQIDSELNATYQQALKLHKGLNPSLTTSQRAWLKSRDLSCNIFTDQHGNDTDLSNQCINDQNLSRIKFLKLVSSLN